MKDKIKIEYYRKAIHISSILLPFFYRYVIFYNRKLMVLLLSGLILTSLVIEILRIESFWGRKIFYEFFGDMMRHHEMDQFSGATYLLLSALISISFFSGPIAFSALAFLSIGDTFAALVGIRFGKRKLFGTSKSLEGSLACFITTFLFAIIFGLNPIIAFTGAISASISEFVDIKIDDNLKIPIFSGFVMSITSLFIL